MKFIELHPGYCLNLAHVISFESCKLYTDGSDGTEILRTDIRQQYAIPYDEVRRKLRCLRPEERGSEFDRLRRAMLPQVFGNSKADERASLVADLELLRNLVHRAEPHRDLLEEILETVDGIASKVL